MAKRQKQFQITRSPYLHAMAFLRSLFVTTGHFQAEKSLIFAAQWVVNVTTSSPEYSQSNGQSERSIKTIKQLLRKATDAQTDPYIAL